MRLQIKYHIMPSIQINSNQYDLNELVNEISKLKTPDLEKFLNQINYTIARNKVTNPSEKELKLIAIIYKPLAEKTQKRYDELTEKLNKEVISKKEHKELLKLIEVAEQHNLKYLKAISELAQLRKTTISKVIKQLGLDKRKH